MGFFDFFRRRSSKKQATAKPAVKKKSFWGALKRLFVGSPVLDGDLLDQLEELLITTDMGMPTAERLIKKLKKHGGKTLNFDQALAILKADIIALLETPPPLPTQEEERTTVPAPQASALKVIFVVGVNGAGKTTTIGKLAHLFAQEGKQVMIGAADTFRAAAVAQLKIWGERVQVPVFSKEAKKDPGAVAYEAIGHAIETGKDCLIIDTAGRLHNKVGLMNELAKVKRVINKKLPGEPKEVLLVLDGSTGQNARQQAMLFNKALGVTGLVITKLDGVSKGGVVIGIAAELGIPIKYIGVGEQATDLQLFDPAAFVAHLLASGDQEA